jgi:hypothetical protein
MTTITLYIDSKYHGKSKTFTEPTLKLPAPFHDEVSSCVVGESSWLLYKDADFSGQSSVLEPGKYPDSKAMGLTNDKLSSIRPLPESASGPSIVLFETTSYGKHLEHLDSASSSLREVDDKTSSVIVTSGTWQLCRDTNFAGDSWVVTANGGPDGNGRYPTYKGYWEKDAISSARPVTSAMDSPIRDDEANPWVDDVPAQFAKLSNNTKVLEIKGNTDDKNIGIKHLQGIATSKRGDYIFLVHSHARELIICRENSPRKIVQDFKMPVSGFDHPGGIQQVGDILIVPMSHDGHGKVVFFDLSSVTDSQRPLLLPPSIADFAHNAWAAGMTTWTKNGQTTHLVAVRGGGSLYLFESNGQSLRSPRATFHAIGNPQSVSHEYEAVNLVTDRSGAVYIIGFWSSGGDAPDGDFVDLMCLDSATLMVSMVKEKQKIHCKNGSLVGPAGVHFRYGGGLRVAAPTRLELVACARNFLAGEIAINIISPSI